MARPSSQQCLTVPAAWLPARVSPPLTTLGPLYFRLLPRLALGLIRTRETDEAVRFELFGLLPLLCFGSPTFHEETGGGRACYPISGGLMLAPDPPKQGYLCLTMARHDAACAFACRSSSTTRASRAAATPRACAACSTSARRPRCTAGSPQRTCATWRWR